MPDFSSYLESVRLHYEQWWSLYTLTDAEGRSQVKAKGEVFDFGLMVQTIAPKSHPTENPVGANRIRPVRQSPEDPIERFTVLEGLRKYAGDHVLLVGRPGSGKSTALARLLLEEAKKEHRIPVLVELRYWNEDGVLGLIRSFLRSLPTQVGLSPVEIDRTTLEELLRSNKFLLLIDGLNELPSEAARLDVQRFRREFPKVAIVFTTRDLSLGGDFGIEKKLEMQPLTETQMKAFVIAYVPEQSEAMLRQLGGRLREFGSTPLLLWMLCGLFRQTGEIPANLGGVFRAFTTGYEGRLKADVVAEGDRRWWAGLLQALAARMMIGDGSVEFRVALARSEVEAIFTEFLRDREAQAAGAARKALDDLLRHHLIQTNGSQVEFRHQLIQEYYAAEWLLGRVKGLDDATLQQDYLNYLKWTEPVALMLALVDDKALALRLVKRALDVDLILGARLAGKVKHNFQIQAVELLDQTIKNNQVSGWIEVKLWGETLLKIAVRKISLCFEYGKASPDFAMYALAKLNCDLSEKEIFKICHKCIGDPHYGVYVDSMVEILGCIDLEESVTTLIKLLQYGDSWTCMRTCQALGKIATKKVSSENAVNALFQILNSAGDDEYDSRGMAAEVLAEIGSEFVINKLAKILQQNSNIWRQEDEEIQFIAATALTKIGTNISLIALERAYLLGNCEIRQNISQALINAKVRSEKVWTRSTDKNEIGWQREIFGSNFLNRIDDIGLNVATHQWIEQLKDESPLTGNYWTIIRTLGFIGTDLSVSALITALISCKGSLEGSVIALALSYSRNDIAAQGIPHLIALPDPVHSESDDIFSAIQIIQSNCKFYNYEIKQQAKLRKAVQPSCLEENRPSLEGGRDDRSVTQNFYGPVYGVAGNVEGNQIISPPPDLLN